MRYRKFFFIHFFCIALFLGLTQATAQEAKINKLLQDLKKSTSDTARVRIYRELSWAYTTKDVDKKSFYSKKYTNLAIKIKADTLVVQGLIDIGISHGMRNKTDSALYYFGKAYDKAKQDDYKLGLARALSNIGYAYDRLENMEGAVKNTLEALDIYMKLKNDKGINSCYLNLGSLYYDMRQYKLAESYFQKVLKINIAKKNKIGIAHSYFTLGNAKKQLKQYNEARVYYDKSLKMATELDNLSEISLARWGIAQVDILEGKYEDALAQLNIALQINRDIKYDFHKFGVLLSTAEAYVSIGDFKKAELYTMEAYEGAKSINSNLILSKSLNMLVKINKKQGKFEKALEYKEDYVVVMDSIKYEKLTKDLILADFDRVRSENDSLQDHNTKISKKNTDYIRVIVITSVLLFVVALLLALYYRKNRQMKQLNELLQAQKEEIASINDTLESLNQEVTDQNRELEEMNKVKNKFFSIVSHDLRSPLGTLKMLFSLFRRGQLNETELSELLKTLEDTIYNTAVFLDNLLEWSKSQLDGMVVKPAPFDIKEQVETNIRLLGSQIKLKELAVENSITEPLLAFADPNMINVVIRNLISNAVKFCRQNDSICIKASIQNDHIEICIRDTGPGISENDLGKIFNLEHTISTSSTGEKGHQIGLVLCKDMIEQNNGTIRVESKLGEGSIFCIILPKA